MALRLRQTADQYPALGAPRDGTDYVVMSGEVVMGRIIRLDGGPRMATGCGALRTSCHSCQPAVG
jgi:hypothetical protein